MQAAPYHMRKLNQSNFNKVFIEQQHQRQQIRYMCATNMTQETTGKHSSVTWFEIPNVFFTAMDKSYQCLLKRKAAVVALDEEGKLQRVQ